MFQLKQTILLQGDSRTAYRDPAVFYRDGVFYLYFTLVETEDDGSVYLYLAMTTSRDLDEFTPVRKLSPRDRSLNYSSPGNVFEYNGSFYLCCQTYCRENGEKYGNGNCRLFLLKSSNLIHWGEPELIPVKGTAVPREAMGRMIDPYVFDNRATDGFFYCFYKQNGASLSRSCDLREWEFCGQFDCGENVCIMKEGELYHLWHSPENGIGHKVSRDLRHWTESGELITLRQSEWEWAKGRLTAGMVLDLRGEPTVGKTLLFFHGTGPEDESVVFDQYACIGCVTGSDLLHWD